MKLILEHIIEEARAGRAVRTHSDFVLPGDIFVAMSGTKTDANLFVEKAEQNGAAFIITENDKIKTTVPTLVVCDIAKTLGQLASAFYKTENYKGELIGITGTNGKTTVSYLIEHILKQAGKKVGVFGTVSYRWMNSEIAAPLTTPDCLTLHRYIGEMIQSGVEVIVMEVSSHALDQNRIAGLNFTQAVYTNLTQDHLDYHKDMETYFMAKAKLFTAENIWSVINIDDDWGKKLALQVKRGVVYGLQKIINKSDYLNILQGSIVEMSQFGIKMEIKYAEHSWDIESALIGKFNGQNILAAQGVCLQIGLTLEQIKDGLKSFCGVKGRLERASAETNIFIDYAHTPDALENVLKTLKELNFKRIVTIFGCGGDRDRTKRPLMANAASLHSDIIFVTSDNPRTENAEYIIDEIILGILPGKEFIRISDRKQAILKALEELQKGDVLLIAGKGHEDYQIIGTKKYPFSDIDIVREALCL